MDTNELITYFNDGESNAVDLLNAIDTKLKNQFLSACKSLSKIVDKVRNVYPDANIYVQEDIPMLLLGSSHSMRGTYATSMNITSNRDLIACTSHSLLGKIDGGGW